MDYHQAAILPKDQLFKELATSQSGLNPNEVSSRLSKYGPNQLHSHQVNAKDIFLRQLKSPFIYLLLAATFIALVLHEFSDAAIILLFITINTILGFLQEYRSETTIKLLQSHLTQTAKTIRQGKTQIVPASELVPGDIVFIETGDQVPADIRLIETKNLSIDESSVTGESLPIEKTSTHNQSNCALSGTMVTQGQGRGVVIATGKMSQIGQTATITAATIHKSIFEIEVAKFSRFVIKLIVTTLTLVFIANLVIKHGQADVGELALFSIALAVSVVPEALPLVTTFSFAKGARKLAQMHVVVKRLSAIEDLGSIEVLCTDKTGTLTENVLTVSDVYPENASTGPTLGAAAAVTQHSFDNALIQNVAKTIPTPSHYEVIEYVPFNPQTRLELTLLKDKHGLVLVARGAPENIMNICNCSPKETVAFTSWIVQKSHEGKRILGIATKKLTSRPKNLDTQTDFNLESLVGFTDPLKHSAIPAIQKAQELGVTIKILTGDRPEVAFTIAQQAGLTSNKNAVIAGDTFEKLSVAEKHAAVSTYTVFARVSPVQKHQIIELLQEKYQVGFLGDGTNDAPALKLANVAIAVKSGSDIARETADIVLLKKDLQVIIDGIKQGRIIFTTTTRYITATLAANFGNFYAVAVASLLIPFLPMLPTQILLVNLLSDFPAIAMATDNVDPKDLQSPKRYNFRSLISLAVILGLVSSLFDFITFGIFSHFGASILQTNWFIESILTELVFIFSIRTRGLFWKAPAPSPSLFWLFIVAGLATVLVPFTALGHHIFSFISPHPTQLATIAILVSLYFIATEIAKNLYFRKTSPNL